MKNHKNWFKGLQWTILSATALFAFAGPNASAQCTENVNTGVTVNESRSGQQPGVQNSNWQAQTFTVQGGGCYMLDQVTVSVKKQGSPSNLVVEIYDAASQTPAWPAALGGSATPLASATVAASLVSTAYTDVTVVFNSPAQLSGGAQYAVVVWQLGGNGQNYYQLGLNQGNPYADGRFCKSNDSGWDCPSGPGGGLDVRLSICVSPCPSGCTYTQGYWKNHPGDWPAEVYSSGLALGTTTYSYVDLMSILHQAVVGNGLISLSHQLITAKLNVLNGAPAPSGVQAAIDAADALIDGNVVPPVGSGFLAPRDTSDLNGTLTQYNEGVFPGGPSHCE